LSSSDRFRQACSRFATGVGVVTTRAADGTPHGLTINSFSSISLDPPVVMVSIAHNCELLEHFGAFFVVNVLREEQVDLSIRFSELPEGRFEGVAWKPGVTGAPVLDFPLAVIECKVLKSVEVGDHRVLFGEAVEVQIEEGRPLVFFGSGYARLKSE